MMTNVLFLVAAVLLVLYCCGVVQRLNREL